MVFATLRKPMAPKIITNVITTALAMHALQLTQIGNSVGVILPKEVLARLKVEKGDLMYLTDSADGLRLTPHDPNFEVQMKAACAIMRKRRNVLHESAK